MIKSLLILGSFSSGALEHQYSRGFKLANWTVWNLDIQNKSRVKKDRNFASKLLHRITPNHFYKEINLEVIYFAKINQPLVILIFKGMELNPETLLELKKHCKLLCNYNPDHPFKLYSKGAGNANVINSIKHFDLHFSYSENICKQLNKDYNVNSYCIPFGYDETVKPIKNKAANLLEQILFIGAWDKDRTLKIKTLSEFNVQVFGPNVWSKKLRSLKNINYHYEPLYGQDYANACLSANGVLNFLRPQNIIEQSHNMRTFEVPAFHGLLISERTDEQLNFFEEDKEAIYFNTIDELKDKLRFYNTHQNLISKIKANAATRSITSGYDYQSRVKLMINYINQYLE